MTTNNMYRVGDFVFFESSVSSPYNIRKIEELNKTQQGVVEAKVICLVRRRDVSKTLLQQAEKHRFLEDDEFFDEDSNTSSPKLHNPKSLEISNDHPGYFKDSHLLNPIQSHQAKHRELFLTRQVESLPATHIRGKCNVTLYNDAEPIFDYLNKEDTFFYKFTYDTSQKTLQSDRNAIRVGSDFQAHVKPFEKESKIHFKNEGELVYSSECNDSDFSKFVLITRSLGTYARAYDPHSISQNPELIFSTSCASRDYSLQRAHDYWFKSQSEINCALSLMLPNGCPKLFKDELEQWTSKEHSLFQQGIEENGKNFFQIQQKVMSWKTLKGIIEFYYMFKSTDKYWQAKRQKISSTVDIKLKQVYIPSHMKPNPSVVCTKPMETNGTGCESCLATKSSQWYIWGANGRLCASCWSYWKRYGGLRNPASRDMSLEVTVDTNVNVPNGDSTENPNQVGSFKCTQPNCDKEFRVKAQLFRHLHNNHGITQHNITNGSYDILNQYSRSANNASNMSNLLSHPTGRGMVRPRSTVVFKVNLQFRCGRVLLSQLIKPKRVARKHSFLSSVELESLFKRIEKIPLQNLSNDCLKRLFEFSRNTKPINDVIDLMWKRKNSTKTPIQTAADELNSSIQPTNGLHENKQSGPLKRPLEQNGSLDDSEPLPKSIRKMTEFSNNVNKSDSNSHNNDLTETSDLVQAINVTKS